MDYRYVGRSGLMVSNVGLGCDNFGHKCDEAQSAAIVQRALDLGITFFDTADMYGPGGLSEEYLGRALKDHRKDAVIATKFVGPTGELWGTGLMHMGTSRRHIMYAVEASLRRLGTDFIDLYQLHFPFPMVPMEETLRALDDLIRQGKVRYIGTSNFNAWQIVDANWLARSRNLTPFVSAQNAYNLLDRQVEKELVPACVEHGVGVLPYFPLASGFLTGKYRRGSQKPHEARLSGERPATAHLVGVDDAIVRQTNPELVRWLTRDCIFTDENFAILDKLEEFAKARGHSLVELAIAWLAGQAGVASVLVGASSVEQIEQNARPADWKLTAEELNEVSGITSSCMYLQPVPRFI
jgi:aryl-alcohol dehydrogenase-like predicted oxidoreductase